MCVLCKLLIKGQNTHFFCKLRTFWGIEDRGPHISRGLFGLELCLDEGWDNGLGCVSCACVLMPRLTCYILNISAPTHDLHYPKGIVGADRKRSPLSTDQYEATSRPTKRCSIISLHVMDCSACLFTGFLCAILIDHMLQSKNRPLVSFC